MNERFDMDNRQLWQSQNFLKNPEYVASLVDRVAINSEDTVVEIGPGKGIITKQLAEKAKTVIGIEYDHKLAQELRGTFSNSKKVKIVEADFMKWDLPKIQYKVFSNIPFNMTADILNKLLVSRSSPEASYLIMQDKAAERFIGRPIGQDSQASVLLQPFFDMGIVTRIDRKQFQPVPNINAVLAKFVKREQPKIDNELTQQYRDFVIYGYNQWKPTILDAYKNVFSNKQIRIINNKYGLERMKPSDLNVEQWVSLFDSYRNFVSDDKKMLVRGFERNMKYRHSGMTKQHRTRRR